MNFGYEKDFVIVLCDVVNGINWYCVGLVFKLKKYICNR